MPASNNLRRTLLVAGSAGGLAAVLLGVAMFAMGRVGSGEARQLLEGMMPTSRFLCAAVITGSATILALMLTMLSSGRQVDDQLPPSHYRRVRHLSRMSMIALISSTSLLTLMCLPIYEQTNEIPNWWYPAIYFGLTGAISALSGAVIGLVVLLYLAISDFIRCVDPHAETQDDPQEGLS